MSVLGLIRAFLKSKGLINVFSMVCLTLLFIGQYGSYGIFCIMHIDAEVPFLIYRGNSGRLGREAESLRGLYHTYIYIGETSYFRTSLSPA